jgi:aspartyl-tRNA(Asn)/glutamyl-tRNA(Gln) amidotransferase subunit A
MLASRGGEPAQGDDVLVTRAGRRGDAVQAARRAAAALWRAPLGDPAYDAAGPAAVGAPPANPPASFAVPEPAVSEPAVLGGLTAPDALAAAARSAGLGAFVAMADRASSGRPDGGLRGPLAGVPVAIKDVFDVAGQRVGNGTTGFGQRTTSADCDAWRRLAAAGAVLLGRTRLPELAWHVRTPGCVNPWSPGRDAGGSSGGSAVAVAAGTVRVALGTDTGGSIRIPAALCGVAGLRPTVGVVSGRGVTPLAPTMDTVGPIAATAAECLLVHRLLTARSPGPGGPARSPAGRPDGATAVAGHGPAGLRVGWPEGFWQDWVSPDVARGVAAAADALRQAGVDMVPVELPPLALAARTAAYVIILAESAGLWHAAATAAGPGEVSDRLAGLLAAGAALAAADYLRARRVAAAIGREVATLLARQRLAALLLPTVPVTAAPTSAESAETGGRAVPVEAAYVAMTGLASVTGLPALSVPCGLAGSGLPLGAQLVGAAHAEAVLCLLGGVIENGPGGQAVAAARGRISAAPPGRQEESG